MTAAFRPRSSFRIPTASTGNPPRRVNPNFDPHPDPTLQQITMKYFQNVVDTVRDLMSYSAIERHYKVSRSLGHSVTERIRTRKPHDLYPATSPTRPTLLPVH